MREVAEALAAAGFDVELPRLRGHGTTVEEMITTRWADWSSDADAAYTTLASRCKKVVVVGLSMGGALTLWLAAEHPEIVGIVCINPAAQPVGDEMIASIQSMIDGGMETFDSIGSDIADPDVKESSYDATPLRPALSMLTEGVAPLAARYPKIKTPMLLINSVNDHVVDPNQGTFLAENYGGFVERVMLERSFHVATQDVEKHIVNAKTLEFAKRVTQL
jgi:carboxylesterase